MTLGSYSVLTVTSTEKAHSTSNVNNIEYFCERLSLHNLSDFENSILFWQLERSWNMYYNTSECKIKITHQKA